MRNVLSYRPGAVFSGQEIKNWCRYQIKNKGSHYKEAKRLYQHYDFKDTCFYELARLPFGPGQDPCRMFPYKLGFIRSK